MRYAKILVAVVAIAGLARMAAGQVVALPDATAWKIDPAHSAANFAVRHLLVSTVRGKLGPVTGTVWYDGANVSSIRADATVDLRKLYTGEDARDSDLRGAEFFAVDRFPVLTFKSRRAVPGTDGHFSLIGDLTIRDVTKEVSLDVEGPSPILKRPREQRTVATATVTLNRFDYGLKWNHLIETGGAIVGPDVKVTIDLEVIK
jgi:polyisoprenoid-binding protein YceI